MQSHETIKLQVDVLKMAAYTLMTPFAAMALNFFLTVNLEAVRITFSGSLKTLFSLLLTYLGYRCLCMAKDFMEVVDAETNIKLN